MGTIFVCPKCKSTDVVNNLSSHSIAVGTFQHEHKCLDCGFEGIFLQMEDESSDF